MILEKNIVGKNILLRTAEDEDAEFILQLRLNPRLNKYLKKIDPSIENQKEWIRQKKKEKNDFHMIIQDLGGVKWGVIALYSIDYKNETFDLGRWIISEKAPLFVAIESIILLYHFAFDTLGLQSALFEARNDTLRVIVFHKNLGAKIIGSDEKYVYFRFDKTAFRKILIMFQCFHNFRLN